MNSELKIKSSTRKLHADDRKALVALARQKVNGAIRLEFKIACFGDADHDTVEALGWPDAIIPMGVKPIDYDMELSYNDLRLPTEGEYWIDVQVAANMARVGWEPEWEPMDWITAEFKDGRMVKAS